MPGRQATFYSSDFMDKCLSQIRAQQKFGQKQVTQAAVIRAAFFEFFARRGAFVGPVLREVLEEHGVGPRLAARCIDHLFEIGALTDSPSDPPPEATAEVPEYPPLAMAIYDFLSSTSLKNDTIIAATKAITGMDRWLKPKPNPAATSKAIRSALEGFHVDQQTVESMLAVLAKARQKDDDLDDTEGSRCLKHFPQTSNR